MNSRSDHRQLLTAALQAMTQAYCPYSDYPVGAAVMDSNGDIFTGCNVENSAYGSTVCAEAAAIAHAVVNGSQDLTTLAIVTKTTGTPCGNCRQILAEKAPHCEILLATPETLDQPQTTTLSKLLPRPFDGLT